MCKTPHSAVCCNANSLAGCAVMVFPIYEEISRIWSSEGQSDYILKRPREEFPSQTFWLDEKKKACFRSAK